MEERYLTSFEDQTSALGYKNGDTTLVSPQVSLVGVDEVVYSKKIPNESKIRFAKDEETGKLYFIVDGGGEIDPTAGYVDLGLSVMWADRNVGAKTPQDYGLYFSWGNVDGHVIDENGNVTDGYSFDENTYSTSFGGQYTGSTLDAEHDAATVNMGSDWRMPTSGETLELVNNTEQYYIDLSGNTVAKSELDGSKLRSVCFVKKGEEFDYNNRSNFIEFPFAADCFDSLLGSEGLYGFVWSSIVRFARVEYARSFYFGSDGLLDGDYYYKRFYGCSVRGVRA